MPRSKLFFALPVALAIGLCALGSRPAQAQELWPDLSSAPRGPGGGEKDAAVIVGAENYFVVAKVPGARKNADDWQAYLTDTLKVPSHKVTLLRDNEATLEEMRKYAAQAAAEVEPGGTLWFVFIGHGAPSKDGKDGVLVGVDAQQRAESLYARSLPRNELLAILSKGKQARTVALLDACFSGRSTSGEALVKGLQPLVVMSASPGAADGRALVLTGAKSDQFAGPLPKAAAMRPAFSYLALGGLRGWADLDGDGKVTAGELVDFAARALKLAKDRTQTPELTAGSSGAVLGGGREKAPDLARIDREGSASGPDFQVSNLPAVPNAQAPKALDSAASGLDFGSVDVDALEKYDAATEFDKGESSPKEKAESWRTLAREAPKFAALAGKRAAEWDRYAAEWKAGEEARARRMEARDSDWAKLSRLLALKVVGAKDKERWSAQFVGAYLKSPGIEPSAAVELVKHTLASPAKEALARLAKSAPAATPGAPQATRGRVTKSEFQMIFENSMKAAMALEASKTEAPAGKAGIQWVSIPGGSFMMGTVLAAGFISGSENPAHSVAVKAFQLAKTEVTNKQYRACVEAGACEPAHISDGSCDVDDGSSWKSGNLPASFLDDEQPVVCVDWKQARKFSEWVGGRLPSEAEWEYAARSLGKDYAYPWGNEQVTCERAVMDDHGKGCGRGSTWPVCSKSAGNTEQGLCDMVGNVREWVQDLYHRSYDGAPTDGSAWESQEGFSRVQRGGTWRDMFDRVRAAERDRPDTGPGARQCHVGFRPAR